MAIRPTTRAVPNPPLHLAEVELFDLAGLRIPRSLTTATLTSRAADATTHMQYTAAKCNNGNPNTTCQSLDPGLLDPYPTLRVYYPCGSGPTSLSRVLVLNRQDCCQERLTAYTLDFVNALGALDRASYKFNETRLTFNITALPV